MPSTAKKKHKHFRRADQYSGEVGKSNGATHDFFGAVAWASLTVSAKLSFKFFTRFLLLLRFVVAHPPSQVRKHVVHVRRIPQAQQHSVRCLSLAYNFPCLNTQTKQKISIQLRRAWGKVLSHLSSAQYRDASSNVNVLSSFRQKSPISILHHLAMTRLFTFGGSIELSN